MSEFINSMLSVRKNWKHYPEWEQKQDDKEAQRKELHKRNNYTQEKLQEADKYGKVIINAVDIMDRYSEDKVEDVEAVLNPLTAMTGFAGTFTTAIIGKKIFTNLFNKLYDNQKIANAPLIQKLNELLIQYHNKNDINYNDYNNFSLYQNLKNFDKENKIEDASIKQEVKKILIEHQKSSEYFRKKEARYGLAFFSAVVLSFPISTIIPILWSTRMQVQTARIARYQARENELKDLKNFVIYTPEQIQEAKKIAANMPDTKKHKKQNWIASIKSLIKDRENYNKWQIIYDNKNQEINFENLNLTPEQLKIAKSDQDVLFRIIRKINDTAEDYAESMESTGGFIVSSSTLGGMIIGKLVSMIPGMSNVSEKITKSFYSNSYFIKKEKRKIEKWSYHTLTDEEIAKRVESIIAQRVKLYKGISFVVLTGILTTIASIPIALKLQKQATRVGRFAAKKELLEDPKNFITYDDNDINSVSNIKATRKKQGLLHRINSDIHFLPKALKLSKEYNQHKKSIENKQIKMQGALNKVESLPNQIEEAKDLQRKVFHTFDKVDEMSQKYSENVEAGTNMILQLAPFGFFFAMFGTLGSIAYLFKKGKITGAKLLQHSLGIVSSFSSLSKKSSTQIIKSLKNSLESAYLKYKSNPELFSARIDDTKEKVIMDRSISSLCLYLKEEFSFAKTALDLANIPEAERKNLLKTIPTAIKHSINLLSDGSNTLIEKENITPKKLLTILIDNKELSKRILQLDYDDLELYRNTLPKNADDFINTLNVEEEFRNIIKIMYSGPDKNFKIPDNFIKFIYDNDAEFQCQINKYNIEEDTIQVLDKILKSGLKSIDEQEFNLIKKIIPKDKDSLKIKTMKKKDFEKLLKNINKFINNIPTDELNNFLNKIDDLHTNDPENFEKFMNNVKFVDLIKNSPYLYSTFILGLSSVFGITTFMFYLITVYCSELQKRAGRIGTMKAIQSLDDPKYFANIYQKVESHSLQTNIEEINQNKLISMFKKQSTMNKTQ